MGRPIALLTLLYFCQGLPGGFLAVVLPVILLEQGRSLTEVGFAGLLSLPWTLKILWAPLVDRWGHPRFGRRKSWMVPAQLGMIACTLGLAFVDPSRQLTWVVWGFVVLNFFAATQDIAVDGFAVGLLRGRDLGAGNAAQVGGFKLGNLFGGGVLLALSGWLGWQGDFVVMAGILAVGLIAVLATREAPAAEAPGIQAKGALRRALVGLFANPWYGFFLILAKFGETVGGTMVKPALVSQGFSREIIGTVDGIAGSIATILGAIVGGWLVRRWGWARALGLCSVLQGGALLWLALYVHGPTSPWGYALRIAVENFAGGGVGVAVFAFAMSRCHRDIGATEFTAAQVLYMSGGALAGPVAGWLADRAGIVPVMALGGGLAVLVGWLAVAQESRLAALGRAPKSR